uniref:FAM86 N-terminal domain-containing protein n=1 Tax=Pavo cristatus TaxID=9049 RepID=A0A8C9EZY9_PAVCR
LGRMAGPGPELGLLFQRRFLAARQLRGMPWAVSWAGRCGARPLGLAVVSFQTVLHPLCVRYPPPASYRRCFLTELIKKHESMAADPLDELYDALARILNEEESTHCYKSYLLPSGEPVTLSESVAIISQGTTGLITWDAALHLAEWAMENPLVTSSLTAMLQKFSTLGADRKPEIYIALTVRNPATYHMFQAELGRCLFRSLRINLTFPKGLHTTSNLSCTFCMLLPHRKVQL